MSYWRWLLPDWKDVLVIALIGFTEVAFVSFLIYSACSSL